MVLIKGSAVLPAEIQVQGACKNNTSQYPVYGIYINGATPYNILNSPKGEKPPLHP
jgi:hypothetical protein